MRFANSLLLAAILTATAATAAADIGVAWQTDFDAARQMAGAQQKLLLVHFWTPNCGPCMTLDKTVFNQQSVGQIVAQHYVPVKLNANDHSGLASSLGITRVPTDVVLTPQGQVVEKFVSQQQPMAYISQVSKVANDYKAQQGRNFAQVPSANQNSAPVHPAYPDFNMGQQTVMSPPAGADTQQNPYANSGSAKPAAPAVAQQVEPRASAVAMSNPYTNQQPLAATQVVNQPTTPSIPETTTAQVQLPPGSPPLGFDGYCPVTMKREWRWQKGDVNWGAVHRGKTYLFSSQEARDEFLKPGNGDLYAPVLGGIDPVLAIDNGNSVPGSRQFSVEYGGNFYLFSSEQTLSQFWGSADRYATGVRQAMAAPAPTNYR